MESTAKTDSKNPIQVADRLFQTVELLADRGAMGLMELSEALHLNKSTAHRVVSSLSYMGYVKQEEETGKYQLTFKLVELSNRIMSKVDIVEVVRPYLKELMQRSQETVHFVQRDGTEAVYIDKVEFAGNNIQMVSRIGSKIPLYRSGVGKAIVATLSPEEIEDLWKQSKIVRMTPYTITDYEEFLRELDEVRERGYALDNEENETGVRCIAAAFADYTGKVKYAFSISAPVSRMDNDRIKELSGYVLDIKARIEKEYVR